jgi:hypothetical protein
VVRTFCSARHTGTGVSNSRNDLTAVDMPYGFDFAV